MRKVLVLGGTGMLGSAVTQTLAQNLGNSAQVQATHRGTLAQSKPNVTWIHFDLQRLSLLEIAKGLRENDVIINCIGLIRQKISEKRLMDRLNAIEINSKFPIELAMFAQSRGIQVIQIATDCVYSGQSGPYAESRLHDPVDLYGQTKSLGETSLTHSPCIRCSIVGTELNGHNSLLSWFLSQPKGSHLKGYVNHLWNGVTTLHFAKLCLGMIRQGFPEASKVVHFLPTGFVSKYELLQMFSRFFGRTDLMIEPVEEEIPIDRRLETEAKELNTNLWNLAGYETPPKIESLIEEYAKFVRRTF